MSRFLVILVAVTLIAGCRIGSSDSGSSTSSGFSSQSAVPSSMGSFASDSNPDSSYSPPTSMGSFTLDSNPDSSYSPQTPVPEPSTIILFGISLGGIIAMRLRKNRNG